MGTLFIVKNSVCFFYNILNLPASASDPFSPLVDLYYNEVYVTPLHRAPLITGFNTNAIKISNRGRYL